MLLKLHREDASQPLLLLPCDRCEWASAFDEKATDLDRSVGLYFDEPRRTIVLRLQRAGAGAACTQVSFDYSGKPRQLSFTLPSNPSLPARCEGGDCPAAADCVVRLPPGGCDSARCPTGCCDGRGACWTERTDTACGQDGKTCKDCASGSGTCLPQLVCSQDCAKSGTSCDEATNPCCSGLVCHQGGCVSPSQHGQPCSAAVPCVDGLTCNDTPAGGFCGLPQCVAAGAACLLGDGCCGDATCSDERCCYAAGHACSAAKDCCGGDCWNGCNPRSWVEGCMSATCQNAQTCVGHMGSCGPDRNDCCRPYRCYNTGSPENPDYECWESWP
ncbi:MAG: hypothetical protein QM765_53060 [Myxococcales bacterium]